MQFAEPTHVSRDERPVVSRLRGLSAQALAARILIIEDEPAIQRILAESLQIAGYMPIIADRGADALLRFRDQAPDLVLLDLILPDMDGLAVCRAIRMESGIPIIVLSALGEVELQVALRDAGADDYLVKPARREILLACIRRAIVRNTPQSSVITSGLLRVDGVRQQVWYGDVMVHLTPTEWDLLRLLCQQPGRVVAYAPISAALWPGETPREAEAIHTIIRQLRQKLGDAVQITNMRGVGYGLFLLEP